MPYTPGAGDARFDRQGDHAGAQQRQPYLGRARAAARPLEARLRRQGRAASGRRRAPGLARRRRPDRVQPRRPAFRRRARVHRYPAGHRRRGRIARDGDDRQRHPRRLSTSCGRSRSAPRRPSPGRPFLYGVGALGEAGAAHVVDLFFDELRTEFQHVGVRSVAEAATITARHPGAWRREEDVIHGAVTIVIDRPNREAASDVSILDISLCRQWGNTRRQRVSAQRRRTALSPIGTFPVPGPTDPCFSFPLAVSPDKRFLFVALRNKPWSVRSFAIDAKSGRLDYLGFGPLADNTCYISTDKTGRFPAERVLSRQQDRREPDRRRRHRAAAPADHRHRDEITFDPRRCGQSPRAVRLPGRRHLLPVAFRCAERASHAERSAVRVGEATFGAAPLRVPSERSDRLSAQRACGHDLRLRLRSRQRPPDREADRQCIDADPWRQDLGDRHSHHAQRQVPLCRGTWIEHPCDV